MAYILKKTGALIATLLIISMLAFIAFQLIPGDPVTSILGTNYTPEMADSLRLELGLANPLPQRYLMWLSGMFTGDLGQSYTYGLPVSQMLSGKLSVTLSMTALAFFLILILSLPLGLLLTWRKGTVLDRVFAVLNQIVMAVPQFFIGIVFTMVFGLMLSLFKPGSFVSYAQSPGGYWAYLFFPALAIALPKAAMVTKLLRSSMLAEMKKDYVRTAYSWGNSRALTLRRHVLRNAIIPVITFLSYTLTDIIVGSVIIEQIFVVPGVGRLLLSSISSRDYPVVQLLVVLMAFLVVIVNYITDLAYRFIDPRLEDM